MPRTERMAVPLAGVVLADADAGTPVDLGTVRGTQLLVLMRHRH